MKAFAGLYRRNPAEFLPEAREGRYTELLRLCYPIHPELFDRLAKDWSSLEKFQRAPDASPTLRTASPTPTSAATTRGNRSSRPSPPVSNDRSVALCVAKLTFCLPAGNHLGLVVI